MSLGPLRFTNVVGGTVDFTYPGPSIDMQSPATAGAIDGSMYVYYAQSFDMTEWEKGICTYTAVTQKFARTSVQKNSLGTTAKISFTNGPQVFILDSFGGGRVTLRADTTYYVRSDGSDSNDGLSDTSAGAFLTIAHALSVASTLDTASFQLTIQVDAGTWTVQVAFPRMVGGKLPIFTGVGSTTIISTAGDCITNDGGTPWKVQNLKLTSSGGAGLVTQNGASIYFQGVEFGACASYQLITFSFSSIKATGNYTITGGASNHMQAVGYLDISGVTVTLTGTPNFSDAFAGASNNGYLRGYANTYVGAATGRRYNSQSGGNIFTGGAGVNYFPGNAAGVGTNTATAPYGTYT